MWVSVHTVAALSGPAGLAQAPAKDIVQNELTFVPVWVLAHISKGIALVRFYCAERINVRFLSETIGVLAHISTRIAPVH